MEEAGKQRADTFAVVAIVKNTHRWHLVPDVTMITTRTATNISGVLQIAK